MLSEYPYFKKSPNNLKRRWFADEFMDLIIWEDSSGRIKNIQLCYGKQTSERALVWNQAGGFQHFWVDSGEPGPLKNLSPMMAEPVEVEIDWLRRSFGQRAREIDQEGRGFVRRKLGEYGEQGK